MNLYLVSTTPDADGAPAAVFVGSQAEAASTRQKLVSDGIARKFIKTSPVNVPTDKEGLLRFLNGMAQSPTVAVAIERLTSQ